MSLKILYSLHGKTPPVTGTGDTSFDGPVNDHLIGLWDFEDGARDKDTGLADGVAQNGVFEGGAAASGGRLMTDGSRDHFDVEGLDAPFQIDQGALMVSFMQEDHVGSSDDTIVNRGEWADRATEGYFGVAVSKDGAVKLQHYADGKPVELATANGFFDEGDTVNVVYSWDAASGASFAVENATTGEVFTTATAETGLTLDIGDNDDERFTFAARESDDGSYDRFFDGKINYVALYDSADPLGGGSLDGILDGTQGDDLIDLAYAGDPEGDRVDNGDAILPGQAPDDDIVLAGAGNDTVLAGEGDDRVFGGTGNDRIYGEAGNDTLFGGGPDTLDDLGPNLIRNGSFEDTTGLGAAGFGFQGTGGVPDWTTDDPSIVVDIHSDGRGGVDPTDGDNWLDLEASPGNFRIGQDVQGIVDGQTYVLTFDAGDGINFDNSFSVIWNGEVLELGGAQVFNPANGDTQTFAFTVTGGTGDGSDRLEFEGFGTEDNFGVSIDNVQMRLLDGDGAGSGNDAIFGGMGDDSIDGGSGNDRLFGEDGNDKILGGSGNDQIRGGDGDDKIIGGAGNDVMRGEDDRDTFKGFGNTDNDVVFGGAGGDDHDTLDLTGSAGEGTLEVIIQGPDSDGNGFDGKVEYFDQGGDKTGQIVFKNIEKIIPCFTPGTRIATPRGEVAVEDLRVGDRVITRDHGLQTIRWIGARALSRTELALAPDLRPVRIRAGALGHGLPERDMLVSPNHRMLVMSDRTQLFFDEAEVLVAAKHLADGDGIARVETDGITYIHLMFDHHEVVLADGCWSESFQPGDWSLKGLDNDQRAELFDLFPELSEERGREGYRAARRSLKKHEARLLIGG